MKIIAVLFVPYISPPISLDFTIPHVNSWVITPLGRLYSKVVMQLSQKKYILRNQEARKQLVRTQEVTPSTNISPPVSGGSQRRL
jgi:hypothetical protein